VLERHGGIWIDATTFFLGPIDDILHYCEEERPDLFAFSGGTMDRAYPMFENFFLAAPKRGRAIRRIAAEYQKTVARGNAQYVKDVCRKIGADKAFQGFPNSPYFSQHVAIQVVIRRQPRIKIGYTHRSNIPYAFQAAYGWNLDLLAEVLTNGIEPPAHVRVIKITGKMRKALDEHLKVNEIHPDSIVGKYLYKTPSEIERVLA